MIGNKVTRSDTGEIELNTSGARDGLAHGYGKHKAATFAALPNVPEHGKIISHKGPYAGHGYDSAVISAPAAVGDETVYVGAIIKDRTQRYKLHEVLTTSKNGASLFKSETTSQGADGPLRNDTPFGKPEGFPTDITLPQGPSGVNTEDMQNGPKSNTDISKEPQGGTLNLEKLELEKNKPYKKQGCQIWDVSL